MAAPEDPWLWDDSPVPAVRPATPVAVYRYAPTTAEGDTLANAMESMPNLRAVSIAQNLGDDPGRAVLRYVFDGSDPSAPQSMEQALSTLSALPRVVKSGDRMIVRATRPDGTDVAVFDGFAYDFGVSMDAGHEAVTIECLGCAYRARDTAIAGAVVRDSLALEDASKNVATATPARFNPLGQPNASAADADAINGAAKPYPVFVDTLLVRTPEVRRAWTAEMAARYVLFSGNDEETFVTLPTAAAVTALLVDRKAKDGVSYDPADPSTYVAGDLACPDTAVTGRVWPAVLEEMIGRHGFAMAYRLSGGGDTPPETTLDLYHPQTKPAKDVYLQARGESFDPERSNAGGLDFGRDLRDVGNVWVVDGAPVRYEASFVLQCGFPSGTADAASAPAIKAFNRADPGFAAVRDSYRLYVFDETADGHYAVGSDVLIAGAPFLDNLFGAGKYVNRRRVPIGELITRGPSGEPLRAELALSTDYAGALPGLWDGTGTWQPIAGNAGWELLKDRIGVWLNMPDANEWHIGGDKTAKAPMVVNAVEAQANNTAGKRFFLRLTCCVDADEAVSATAARRDACPLPYDVTRRLDARDRYRKYVVAANSLNNSATTKVSARDDTALAQAEADALQTATDAGILQGTVDIPRLTLWYELGDRLESVNGRGLGLRTDGGGDENAPILPIVIGRELHFEPDQRTVLHLSDAGLAHRQYRAKRRPPERRGRGRRRR